jgi:hypothetical protein
MRSFVIGNGSSRLGFDLSKLRPHGKIFGCNALYRDFTPDCLVAVDAKMLFEIAETGYQHRYPVYTNKQEKIKHLNGFKYITPRLGWSSGSTAVYLAVRDAPKEIFLIGFDFVSETPTVNNVYAGTKNYTPLDSKPVIHFNWEDQIKSIIKTTPHINFYRVYKSLDYKLPIISKNFSEISYEEFNKILSL